MRRLFGSHEARTQEVTSLLPLALHHARQRTAARTAKGPPKRAFRETGVTGLEPAASGLTGLFRLRVSTGEHGQGGGFGCPAPPYGKPDLCGSVSHLASHLQPHRAGEVVSFREVIGEDVDVHLHREAGIGVPEQAGYHGDVCAGVNPP